MSKEFWLDWKNYDFERMSDFILIWNIIDKKRENGYNRSSFKNNGWMNSAS